MIKTGTMPTITLHDDSVQFTGDKGNDIASVTIRKKQKVILISLDDMTEIYIDLGNIFANI